MLDVQSVPAQILVEQLILVLVLESLLVLVDPILRILALDFRRHQPAKHGVAGKLGGGGDDAVVHPVLLRAEILLHGRLQVFPLVVAEIVDDNQECRAVLLEQGEELVAQHGGAEQGFVGGGVGVAQPVHIVPFIELAEQLVGLGLLRRENLVDVVVVRAAQFQVPVHQLAIQLNPLAVAQPPGELHAYLAELLLVGHRAALALQPPRFGVLLDDHKYLVGVHRLDKVVADFAAEGLVHDVLLLALGNHDNWHMGVAGLKLAEGVQTAQSRHVLVQKDNVYTLAVFIKRIEGLGAAHHRNDGITALLEKKDVGFQQVDFVIGP